MFEAVICALLSNSIGIVTQKNGFDKLLSQILKKILTIAFLFAQNAQKIKKPRRVVGAVFEIVLMGFNPRFRAAQTCFFAACADASDFGVFKSDISIVNKLFIQVNTRKRKTPIF